MMYVGLLLLISFITIHKLSVFIGFVRYSHCADHLTRVTILSNLRVWCAVYSIRVKMEALKLNENEQQRFEELFQMCDLAKTAKIPKLVVGELLASSGLATDVSLQVSGITVS